VQILLDLIGAAVIAGMIVYSVVGLNGTMTDGAFQTTLDKITQENSQAIADLINHDFYKIGYHATLDASKPIILLADSERITFLSDIENKGVLDTVKYYTSDIVDSLDGSSLVFKKLYRTVNSASAGDGARLGLTSFKLTYFDRFGSLINLTSPTTDTIGLSNIKSVRVVMFVRNQVSADTTTVSTYDTTFSSVYWEKFISPKNLRTLK